MLTGCYKLSSVNFKMERDGGNDMVPPDHEEELTPEAQERPDENAAPERDIFSGHEEASELEGDDGAPPDDAGGPEEASYKDSTEGDFLAEGEKLEDAESFEYTDYLGDGDPGDEEILEPYPAPDFALVDYNPASPTYLLERRLSDAHGKVIVLYFVGYG